ncbi:glutamate-5-semialdehyde dehydrogenase [Dongia mobilis]|uniref:Gamma-glutamyl phosphate reductase n=1 Tax=Dongia mobilis TaxID=578943 RepID=A0A4R6WQQ9_9PROT|nr:glutamate-5-semialdehyde dehydrogenase [Dongia mobilis]TDQ78882.1 glutamate-5-semialdehyde dehydrogenase [Dongia mobilis]
MTALKKDTGDALMDEMLALGRAAKAASLKLAQAPREKKDLALKAMAAEIRAQAPKILAANERDMAAARARGLGAALLDRLLLDEKRVDGMAQGLEEVAQLPDPVGRSLGAWERPNGLRIERVAVPLGVIGIIYESRPNVTADAAGLCLKSGNAAILRGGSESAHSAAAILDCLQEGLCAAGLPKAAVQRLPTTDRAAVGIMLGLVEYIDLIIPRGGKGLIERVASESRIPVLKHLDGICHTYVDRAADPEMARKVVLNAKMRRTGICGATETLLIDRPALAFTKPILDDLIKAGCEIRGDAEIQALDKRVSAASPEDWDTEYLDAILSVKVVDGVGEAIEHIARHSSHHTEAIITADETAARRFLSEIDSGILLWNASTQFADGGEFGMGAEIGISTGKLHARGPVGAEQLTSYKYIVRGNGQVRP